MLLMKSGVLSVTPESAPSKTISIASFLRPTLSRRSLSRAPFQRAQPMAPLLHCTPGTCGWNRPRRLPEQRLTATSSAAGNRLRSSSVNSAWPLAPSPPTTIFQVLRDVREMVANEKCVIRRDGGTEIFDRRFVVRRPIAELDQRLLARQRIEHGVVAGPLRQRRGQIDGSTRCPRRPQLEARPGERKPRARCLDKMPTCEHGVLLPGLFFSWQGVSRNILCPDGKILN